MNNNMINDAKILNCCPYCGEDYMFEKISSTNYYNNNNDVTMTTNVYYCCSCHKVSTIIHDYENMRSYCGNDD